MRNFVALGAVGGFLAVALGAFGAHALRERISPEMLAVYQTGVQYHLVHALALLLVGLLRERLTSASSLVSVCGALFGVGIVLFSGSLYVLAVTGIRAFGAITPLGGVCFLVGWALLAVAAMKQQPPSGKG